MHMQDVEHGRKMAQPLLPVRFQELHRHCAALRDEHYWLADGLGDPDLEAQMRAAAFVCHGSYLHKWRKEGRGRPHRRFVRVSCGASSLSGRRLTTLLHWDKRSEEVVRLVLPG